MRIKKVDKQEAERLFHSWNDTPPSEGFDIDNQALRNELTAAYNRIISMVENKKISLYYIDMKFGLELFNILYKYDQFNVRTASNNDFWRYLSIKVIPDVVYDRWGMTEARFWKEPRRIWLKVLWWYIYLSWQGNTADTESALQDNTTDEIAQLVERAGSQGYRPEVTREIMRHYGSLDKSLKSRNILLFRRLMKLNTARTETLEPGLFPEGEKAYVEELFRYFTEIKVSNN
ncbi:hypothetical protein [Alkalicoccus daliensis]|uniref:Uncharacterized protein n=1 Tax=Alkalicoccus daliensis TaxID=745820 RepID=A0A1H0E9Y9_9BACI|nr:hypothetical protein [Alkalicoccus daliensis]SDN79149.1 hypothetical protein SAMN04488053_103258 [Alkalicoccus daliensis]